MAGSSKKRGTHRAGSPNADLVSMVLGAVLTLTGGVALIGADAARDMLGAGPSTDDWYCYAAPANEWECHPDPVDGRVAVYVGPESGIQPALDEAFDRDQIIEDANIGGNFNPDADLDMSQVEVRR